MFNFSGSEIVFLLLLALIILGPDKLPDAIKKFGKTYAEFKKVSSGFQNELRSALDEPMREMRSTADILKNAASFDTLTDTSPKPVSGSMAAATPVAATPTETQAVQPQAVQPPFQMSKPADDAASGTADPTGTPDAAGSPDAAGTPDAAGSPGTAGAADPAESAELAADPSTPPDTEQALGEPTA